MGGYSLVISVMERKIIIDYFLWKINGTIKTESYCCCLTDMKDKAAEHSSARMERYLQLVLDIICLLRIVQLNNFFHLLRRQMKTKFRKPFSVFTKRVCCVIKGSFNSRGIATGSFQKLLMTKQWTKKSYKSCVCTGKFYYDIMPKGKKRS
jgi:2-oxoglutarate dehydrogenase E1 component